MDIISFCFAGRDGARPVSQNPVVQNENKQPAKNPQAPRPQNISPPKKILCGSEPVPSIAEGRPLRSKIPLQIFPINHSSIVHCQLSIARSPPKSAPGAKRKPTELNRSGFLSSFILHLSSSRQLCPLNSQLSTLNSPEPNRAQFTSASESSLGLTRFGAPLELDPLRSPTWSKIDE
jgi:hypothetical protein